MNSEQVVLHLKLCHERQHMTETKRSADRQDTSNQNNSKTLVSLFVLRGIHLSWNFEIDRELSQEMVTSSSFNIGSPPFESRGGKSWRPKPGTSFHFIFMTVLVFITYICYGLLQEAIFTKQELKPYGWFLTWIQFAFYVVFGSAEFAFQGQITRKIPLKYYILLAFLTVATMGLSNTSLRYLNYPTQVIFKSCKLIPVMIGGIFMQNKRYKCIDYLGELEHFEISS